jgi:AcrR family transcriptional regulator
LSSASPRPSARLGRPRRFDGDTERKLLMDAAIKVMTKGDYLEVAIADVLAEAGLSTRSFYRHFESKEALLVALMRRDADKVGQSLDRVVADAPDPASAVTAWLDSYLAGFYEPKRARRTTLYSSPGARTSQAVNAAHAELQQVVVRSLVTALRAGHRSGALYSPDPQHDAMTVLALTNTAVGIAGLRRSRRAARDHIMRFAWPALGLTARSSQPTAS